jgi:hypothetical protein
MPNFSAVKCSRTKPKPQNSADSECIAISDDGANSYVCKGQRTNVLLPLMEWVCASLALDCGLPVPPFEVIELMTNPGTYYFGSQWIDGAVDYTEGINRVSNSSVFSETLAVDNFVHNVDRHMGNFLFLDLSNEVQIKPIDFSRALLTSGWPMPNLPFSPNDNTASQKFKWLSLYPYQDQCSLLQIIKSLPGDWMQCKLDEIPPGWIVNNARQALCDWWDSDQRTFRADEVLKYLP